MSDGVERLLVTASDEARMVLWARTAHFANWLDGKDNRHGGQTWILTVYATEYEQFMQLARGIDNQVTIERIVGAGDSEEYEMIMGTPGEGWGRA